MTTVRPPPGVSSSTIRPPIAWTKPRATARPRPTPAWVLRSPRRWNGSKTRSRSAGEPGALVDDPQVHEAVHRRASMRTGRRGRPRRRRWTRRWPRPARAGPGRPGRRQGLGHGPLDAAGRRTSRGERGGHDVLQVDGPVATSTAPACSRLMSSRLPTTRFSRSVSASMVAGNSWRCSRPGHVVLQQAVTDALIDASGVRRSCDTACSRAVRRASVRPGGAAVAASAWSAGSRGRAPAATGTSAAPARRRPTSCGPRTTSTRLASTAISQGVVERLGRRDAARRGHDDQASSRLRQQRDRVEGERGADLVDQPGNGSRSPISVAVVRASASASARARSASRLRCGAVDEKPRRQRWRRRHERRRGSRARRS